MKFMSFACFSPGPLALMSFDELESLIENRIKASIKQELNDTQAR